MKKHLFLIVAALFAIGAVSFAVANLREVSAQKKRDDLKQELVQDAQWKALQDKVGGLTQENEYLKTQCQKGQQIIAGQPTLVKQKVSLQCSLPPVK